MQIKSRLFIFTSENGGRRGNKFIVKMVNLIKISKVKNILDFFFFIYLFVVSFRDTVTTAGARYHIIV